MSPKILPCSLESLCIIYKFDVGIKELNKTILVKETLPQNRNHVFGSNTKLTNQSYLLKYYQDNIHNSPLI